MKYIINDNQIGYLVCNGRFERVLTPGKYSFSSMRGYDVLITDAVGQVETFGIPVKMLQQDEFFAANTVERTVPAGTFVFIIVNGTPFKCVTAEKILLWAVYDDIELVEFTPETPEIPSDFPRTLLPVIPHSAVSRLEVAPGNVAMLYYDNAFVRELSAGIYYFWKMGVNVGKRTVNISRQLLSLPAQELLTSDKVTVRVTMALEYTVTDARFFAESMTDGEEQLRLAAQMALRDYVGSMKLEELLEKRSEFSGFLVERLNKSDCSGWCEFATAGIKDVIIPGDIRDIMNTVLLAEKKAQANVITRREEVASTRSLLNTAKLMEDNPTLMRLKELEYLERICDRVDSISVSGGADLLAQLGRLCGKQAE